MSVTGPLHQAGRHCHRQGRRSAGSTSRSATSGCAPTATTSTCASPARFAHYLDDPYTPRTEREPKTDHVTVAFIGGGFAGLVTGARLKEAGVDDVRIIEKGGDFGGTWYWNRYPGRSATRRRWSTCRCSRRPATCRPRSTRTRRRSSSTASASGSTSASTTTRCSTPR